MDQIAEILQTIRQMESGGNYQAYNAGGGASGAYQYIQSTWYDEATAAGQAGVNVDGTSVANWAGNPAAAAPPAVQDAVAAYNVQGILNTYRGDVSKVPLIWYYPAAASNPGLLDTVPYPSAGNTLTPRQYQSRWMATFNQIAGGGAPTARSSGGSAGSLIGGVNVPIIGSIPIVGGIVNGIATAAKQDVLKITIIGVVLAGAVALIVAGGWRAVAPTIKPKLDQAKTAAAVAAA